MAAKVTTGFYYNKCLHSKYECMRVAYKEHTQQDIENFKFNNKNAGRLSYQVQQGKSLSYIFNIINVDCLQLGSLGSEYENV